MEVVLSRIVLIGKWFAAAMVVLGTMGAGIIFWQNRQPPVANSLYVALGSSFAAGFGLGHRAPDSPITSQRSTNGYPQQLARLLKPESFTDVTSSGSTMQHVLHGGQMKLRPQVDALGPDTRLVTLTAGGNDVGYVGDLTAMAYSNRDGLIGTLVKAFWQGAEPIEARNFAGLGMTLRATLAEISRRSPRARIVVVTYPVILPPSGTCSELGITQRQAALMRQVGDTLAQTTRDAANEAGATIVDMATLSAGHDACSKEPWVSGFQPSSGADFHPTQAGASATAHAIARAIG